MSSFMSSGSKNGSAKLCIAQALTDLNPHADPSMCWHSRCVQLLRAFGLCHISISSCLIFVLVLLHFKFKLFFLTQIHHSGSYVKDALGS